MIEPLPFNDEWILFPVAVHQMRDMHASFLYCHLSFIAVSGPERFNCSIQELSEKAKPPLAVDEVYRALKALIKGNFIEVGKGERLDEISVYLPTRRVTQDEARKLVAGVNEWPTTSST